MATGPILIDTGPLVSLFDRRDEHFAVCSERAKTLPGQLYTCLPVITEAAYLLNRQDSRLVDMLYAACRDGVYQLLRIEASDFDSILTIRSTYHDLALDFADAALMHIAERDGIGTIFTLDRRDFSVYRPSRGETLTIIPD